MADLQTYFYDKQIRRFLLQFIRAMSNFQVEYGNDSSGSTALIQVPVVYGDPSRQASMILRDNSENNIGNVPVMAVYISDLSYSRNRLQEPNFVDKRHVRLRKFNPDTQTYESTQGNAFTVERLMPAPWELQLKVDIWTSNTEQKLQLLEQILPLFNPSIEIQNTDNYLDWTSLSAIELIGHNWSSRSIPTGANEQIDIATLTFNLPIWLTGPAKVKKLGVIHKIIAGVYDSESDLDAHLLDDDILSNNRTIITPTTHSMVLLNNKLQLFNINGNILNTDANSPSAKAVPESWDTLINLYGSYSPGISQIKLLQSDGISEIIGTISPDPADASIMNFSIDLDTIPGNTLPAITAIIDPYRSGPGTGLPPASAGQRYLILNDIGSNQDSQSAIAWRGTNGSELVAKQNDIIEYDGTQWNVSFDSGSNTIEYVTNLTTLTQYKWSDQKWTKSYDGEYQAGSWSIIL